MRKKPPFELVIEQANYHWWWRVENACGEVVDIIGSPVTNIKEPDGQVLRGATATRWGAIFKGRQKLRALNAYFVDEERRKARRGKTERISV